MEERSRAPTRAVTLSLPAKTSPSPAIEGLSLNLHIENLFEVHIIKMLVMTEGLQKEVFPLKNSFVSGTGILLKADLCKTYTCS